MRLKSAIFVDFDSFSRLDGSLHSRDDLPALLDNPRALVSCIAAGDHASGAEGRRDVPVRRIYTSREDDPVDAFGQAGFSTVKSASSEIGMTVDVLDFLEHKAGFDEFFIVSANEGFGLLLERIQSRGRLVGVYDPKGNPGYGSVNPDFVIDNPLLEQAIEKDADFDAASGYAHDAIPEESEPKAGTREIIEAAGKQIMRAIAIQGPMDAGRIPRFFTNFREFREAGRNGERWFGYKSLKELAYKLEQLVPGLRVEETAGDPQNWVLVLDDKAEVSRDGGAAFRAGILTCIGQIVAEAAEPMPLSRLGLEIGQRMGSGPKDTEWGGAGSLSGLIKQAGNFPLDVSDLGQGYIFDPLRHDASKIQARELPARASYGDSLDAFIAEVSGLTNMPQIGPVEYGGMFKALHEAVCEEGFPGILNLSKKVRDLCRSNNIRVARSHVNFILNQLTANRYFLDEETTDPDTLAEAVAERTIDLLEKSGRQLDEYEEDMLDQMFGLLPLDDEAQTEAV